MARFATRFSIDMTFDADVELAILAQTTVCSCPVLLQDFSG